MTTDVSSSGSFWSGIGDSVKTGLDYWIADSFGVPYAGIPSGDIQSPMYPTNRFPETIVPKNTVPTEPGFKIGNNVGTWGIGMIVLAGLGVIAFMSAK